MGSRLGHTAIVLLLMGSFSLASAQELNPSVTSDLQLTSDQKHTIYLSISNLKQREAEPPTFRAAVGAAVPPSITLQPLPKTIVDLMPPVKDLEYAMVANQVILVDPKSKRVVEVINE